LGIRVVVDAILDGADVESVFKDIMTVLSKERRPDKNAKDAD